MTIFKENIVDTSLIGPILTALLAAAGFYCKFWFTRYQASRDQAQKVSRAIEDVLSKMAALFGQKKPALRCTGNSGHYHLFFFKQPSDDIFP
ncbi:TPA: hypothetical protein HIQ38_004589 [Escherichia coli]|uniref:hypothetical protein n=1 Tax=Escherichia coli TaxID=562 RepID=UPI0005EB68E6|nr:hypothetical protein [Escherichia coli]EEV6030545.1 hypothetical protein [Escherichia coli]EFD7696260.1 hypothetical protein [Escherichia coli]EFH6083537.1 hypothetical protein [Escherichia coli]EFN4892366.1 hypothetical protein [Escherichia coli]EFN6124959.1 hypothetical protein [Escherichia coli]